MTLTLRLGPQEVTIALRPDTAEYLMDAITLDPRDWRLKDLMVAVWAAAQGFK